MNKSLFFLVSMLFLFGAMQSADAMQASGTMRIQVRMSNVTTFQGYSIRLMKTGVENSSKEFSIPDNGSLTLNDLAFGSYTVWLVEGGDAIVVSKQVSIESSSPLQVVLERKKQTTGETGISGTVTNSRTQEPIVGATVRILELNRMAHTGTGGKFEFNDIPSGTYTIFVRVIGYASKSSSVIVSSNMAVASFMLRESAIEGEEIIVSSPRAGVSSDLYQPAESKSLEEFQESQGSSFAEKISDLPGVSVRGNGSAPSRPILRGLTDNETLIIENGMRMGDLATFDPAHATPIQTQEITQIDVVRGPASVMFGPNAIGGLVNIITNTIPTFSTQPFSGTLTLGGNSVNDEYNAHFDGVFSSGGSAFGIFAGGSHSQDIHIPSGSYFDPASGASFDLSRMPQSFNHTSEFGAGYSYQSDFGMLGIGYKYYEMNYGIPGDPPNDDWADFPPTTSRISQIRNMLELKSLFTVDGALVKQIRFNANYNDYSHSEFPTAQDATGISDPQANHFHKQSFNSDLQFQHRLSDELQGTLGIWTDIENLTIEGDQPLGPNSRTTDLAGYLFEEYAAGSNTRIQAGVRFDYNHIQTSPYAESTDPIFQTLDVEKTNNAFTASIGVIQKLSNELTGSFNIGRSFRAPTVQELYANGLDAASSSYSLGDSSLVPETGLGIDASLKGNYDNFSFELSPYINFISNYIYGYLPGPDSDDFPIRQFAQTDARLMGFEVSANYQLMTNFAVRASIDYVNAEQTKDTVQPLPFIPPMRGLLRLMYQDNTFTAKLDWRLAASQTRLGVGDTPTAGYGIVNIGAAVRLPQNGMVHSIGLYCDNLFNQIYRDNLSVIKDFIPQPGRGIRLNYTMLF